MKESRMTKSRNKRLADGWVRFECWIKPVWRKKVIEFLRSLGK